MLGLTGVLSRAGGRFSSAMFFVGEFASLFSTFGSIDFDALTFVFTFGRRENPSLAVPSAFRISEGIWSFSESTLLTGDCRGLLGGRGSGKGAELPNLAPDVRGPSGLKPAFGVERDPPALFLAMLFPGNCFLLLPSSIGCLDVFTVMVASPVFPPPKASTEWPLILGDRAGSGSTIGLISRVS